MPRRRSTTSRPFKGTTTRNDFRRFPVLAGGPGIAPAGRHLSARHHRRRFDLDPRRLFNQTDDLDQRHRRIMRAEDLAIDLPERLQVRQILLHVDDIPGETNEVHGQVYREIFGAHYPAMALVQVVRLVEKAARVEIEAVSYTHLRAHETRHDLVCRLLLEKKK